MLKIQDIHKSFGKQVLFDGASLQMSPGERIGLVGRNGYGKSTLFKLILKEEDPEEGLVNTPKNYRIGHLAQHLNFTKPTILEEGCLGLMPEEEWDHYKVETILFGLGFTKKDMDRKPSEFSGGFQIRLNLAKVLVSNPNLLLLDEPTNYLDIVSIRWLTEFLRSWENEMIIVSHDREFMDSVTTHTALIHRQKIKKVEGGTAKLYALVEQEEETYEKTRQNEEKQRKHAEEFISRFRAQAGRAAMVQSRIKQLEKMPKLEELSTIQNLDFDFHYAPIESKTLMEVNNVSFHYTPEVPLIPEFSLQVKSKDRIAIIGKNGKGKSTLLNVLAGELKPVTGEVKTHIHAKLGYFGQTNISRLTPKMTVEEEIGSANAHLGRTQVRGICGVMMFSGEMAEKRVSSLSGGEKSRVLLGKILAQPSNLLFLDEPTNHLDMQSIDALIESIHNFEGASLIVTHSEEILRKVATKLVVFHHGTVEIFNGNYDEFLEKIGWEEPNGEEEVVAAGSVKPTQKVIKRQKAELINDRSAELKPLKDELTKLENEIDQCEKKISSSNADLIKASQEKNTALYAQLSKEVKEAQKTMEKKFERLESVSNQVNAIESRYERLIADVAE